MLSATPKGARVSNRKTYEQYERSTGKLHPELDSPELPPAVAHVWGWFKSLHTRRGGSMGPEPLSWRELHAWSAMTGIRPSSWELEALDGLDDCWIAEQAKKN